MASNFPGPYEIRLFYDTTPTGLTPAQHTARFNCDIVGAVPPGGTPATAIQLRDRDGGTTQLNAALEALLILYAELYPASTNFSLAEFWKYDPGTFDATFITAWSPLVNVGTSVNPSVPAGQAIFTFRTQEGGTMRLSLMESDRDPGVSQGFPTGNTKLDNIFAYVNSDTSWLLGRDTSYPIAAYRYHPGQNEALFKKRYR